MFFEKGNEVSRRLMQLKEQIEWDRANPENPVCPDCNNREDPAKLYAKLDGTLVCAECMDNETQRLTGCRWGTPETCRHPDCK